LLHILLKIRENFFTDLSLEAVFSSKLTDTDAWFVLDPKRPKRFEHLLENINHKLTTMWTMNQNIVYQGHFCRAIGWTGFRWIYGSPGA
jgi:hypothetical protein